MTKAAELAKMGEVLTNSQIGGRRNIIINGAMLVAQRGTSFNYTTTDAYSLDRFRIDVTGGDNSAGAFTLTQADITDLPGFTKAMKFDVTTADTSIAAGEALNLSYRIEGQDLQQLKKGTSEAEKFTISFYVKGTAKTYALEVLDIDTSGNRSIAKTFNVTTSWNRIILTFDGDTTGPLDNDANRSLDLNFFFHAGSTYTGGTLQTSWGAMTNNERAAGIDSLYSSTDNELFITGLQMEVGSQATPFEHRSFGEEARLCHRYYQRMSRETGLGLCGVGVGPYNSTTAIFIEAVLSTRMRGQPAVGFSQLSDFDLEPYDTAPTAIVLHSNGGGSTSNVIRLQATDGTTRVKGYCAELVIDIEGGYIDFDAEL